MRGEVQVLECSLRGGMNALESRLRVEMHALESRRLLRLGGIMVAGIAVVPTLVKLL